MKKFYKDPLGHYLKLRRIKHPTLKKKVQPKPLKENKND